MNSAVAIVGLACRFPGASDAGAYWRLLRDGVDAIGEIPRWDARRLHREGRIASLHGGFLDDVEHFDAAFFGITPREAAAMDPQQRLSLELAWEALEDAGIVPASLAKTDTGIFIGATTWDYNKIANSDVRFMTAHAGTGTVLCSLANRISYLLNLRGPSMAVDTACSSSLTAVHLACRSLRSGESALALAGGVNLILSPESSIVLSQGGMLSPDGRCKAFDAAADGYGRSEGAGIVVLKRAADAARDGDRVLAYVRGTAINQNGLSNGLSAPNGAAQQDVMKKALRDAGLAAKDVGCVEAHGTGTALGDPIEAAALRAVFMEGRTDEPCAIGSVKSNIGHTEAAAGIAGLIKVVLAMQHGVIPRSLHVSALNPRVVAALEGTPMFVARENVAWPSPRFGAVSSFGFGGANAHAVLEEAPAHAGGADDRSWLLPLSARGSAALGQEARAMATFLRTTDVPLSDVAFTAAMRRTHHPTRLAVVAQTRDEAADALMAFARGEEHPRLARGPERAAKRKPKLVFVFSGQGSQSPGMASELARSEPVFREALEHCHVAMRPYVDGELPVQPAIFAVQFALAALWASWGVTPDCVLGHSMGEIAAACVSGGLSLDDAARVVCERSRLVLRSSGAMVSVELSRAEAEDAIRPYGERIAVAASNGPRATILSGDESALRALSASLDARDVFARAIDVTFASHSARMDPLRDELLQKLARLEPREPNVRFVSTVEGEQAPTFDAAYWWKNLRRPVLFWERVSELLDEGYETYVEVSPHPVLVPSIPAARTLPSLRRGQPDALLGSLGALHAAGYPVALDRVQSPHGRVVSLPPYPWQKERYWLDVEPAKSPPPPAPSEMLFESVWQPEAAGPVPPGTTMVFEERGTTAVTFEGEPPANIVYLASRDSTLRDDVCGPLLRLVQAMVDAAWPAPPRLFIVTGDPASHLACASLWGMGLTVAREHPEFRCTLVENHDDIPFEPRMAGEGDERVRLRDGQRFVARLTAAPAIQAPFVVHSEGAYAITGAGGDLGRLVQKWLVDKGARHLVLLGRTPIVTAWPGVRVDSIAVDVSDVDAVEQALAPLPLRGVFHLAGSLDDGTLTTLTGERFHNHVFSAKALGAFNLHRATRALDAFVVFSSAASSFGAPGAANYAAANAVVDALATHRHRQGLPATSIAWGPWLGQGLAVGKEREGRLAAQGITGLTEAEGLALLERALGSGRPHLTAVKMGKALRARGPLRRFLSLKKSTTTFSSVEALLCHEIAAITGLRTVPREETFHGMGLDSLAMLELRNAVEAELGVYLPIATLMAHPTVCDLAAVLRGKVDTGGTIRRFSRRASPRLRLFCLAAAGADPSTFRDWPRALPAWVDVCAIQPAGRERWAAVLDEIVTALSAELDLPFAFFGWSMGALLAYQAALQIHRAKGVWPEHFFAAASTHPGGVDELRRRHSKDAWLLALGAHAEGEFRRLIEADTALVYGATIEDQGPLGCPISAFAGEADPIIPSLAPWHSSTRDRFVHRVVAGGHRFPQTHASELLAWVRTELEENHAP